MSLDIYGRAAWGARYADGFGPAPVPAQELWLHHSVTAAPPVTATFAQDASAVRQLEQIGQDRFGGGISYSFVIAPSGRAFLGHSVNRKGAHTAGRNSIARAICLIGNYDVDRPSDAQIAATAALVAAGASAGWWQRAALDGGHRDAPGASTACPGQFAYALIPVINSRALAPQEEADMDTQQDARLRRVEHALELLVRQVCGEAATIENPFPGAAVGGWPTDRLYGSPQERLTLIMFLQRIDRQLNSGLSLEGRPGGDIDNAFGHLASVRAELHNVLDLLEETPNG